MYHLQNARGQLFHFFRVKSFFPTLEYIKLYAAMPNKTILFINILLDVVTLTITSKRMQYKNKKYSRMCARKRTLLQV